MKLGSENLEFTAGAFPNEVAQAPAWSRAGSTRESTERLVKVGITLYGKWERGLAKDKQKDFEMELLGYIGSFSLNA